MTRRLDSLQALRGIACLAVLGNHLADVDAGFGPGSTAAWVNRVGFAGVDLFFVLSGYIITAANRRDLGEPGRLPGYLFRRAWRVYPTFWAALAVTALAWGSVPGGPWEWVTAALLLPRDGPPLLLPVAWTLSYELMFYLGFGLLLLLPRRVGPAVLLAWAVVVAGAVATGVRPHHPAGMLPLDPFVLEFLAGVVIGWRPVPVGRRTAAFLAVVAAGWAVAGIGLAWHPDPSWLLDHNRPRVLVFGLPSALVVLAVSGRELAGGRAWPRWLVAVGDASYAIYLTHPAVLITVVRFALMVGGPHDPPGRLALLAVCAAAAVGFGLYFHRLVERPLLAWGSRLGRSRLQPSQRPTTRVQIAHPA